MNKPNLAESTVRSSAHLRMGQQGFQLPSCPTRTDRFSLPVLYYSALQFWIRRLLLWFCHVDYYFPQHWIRATWHIHSIPGLCNVNTHIITEHVFTSQAAGVCMVRHNRTQFGRIPFMEFSVTCIIVPLTLF
jgi:hypothetical protein